MAGKKFLALLFASLVASPALTIAQSLNEVAIFGFVKNRVTGEGVSGITVHVINEADTTERNIAITDVTGKYATSLAIDVRSEPGPVPADFRLEQNYPNPFNPSTVILFQLTRPSETRLVIYNSLGQRVRTLVNQTLAAGQYSLVWDATTDAGVGLAAGVYFYQLRAEDFVQTKKMVLLDGSNGALSGFVRTLARPQPQAVPAKSSDLRVTLRAMGSRIIASERRNVLIPSSNFQVDLDVEVVQESGINRDLILISEPGVNGEVYVSGLPNAVIDAVVGAATVTVRNTQNQEIVSAPVDLDGSIPLLSLQAQVEDQLTLTLTDEEGQVGEAIYVAVSESAKPRVTRSNITDSNITNGNKEVIVDAIIIIEFSEPVEVATVNENSFFLADNSGKVPATIGFLNDNTTATLDPDELLAALTTYTLIVTTAVLDLQGNPLQSQFEISFTTGNIIINVPGDQASIQAGIDAAADGDTVLVADGTYFECIDFKGKAIIVASFYLMDADTSHISNTIIDGSQPSHPDSGSVVSFISGEDTTSILYGFTITHGTGTITEETWLGKVNAIREGGGIFCYFSGASIMYNKIINNNVSFYNISGGGGVSGIPPGNDAYIILVGNQITYNTVTGDVQAGGSGLTLTCNATLTDNVISHNTSTTNGIASGAILCFADLTDPRTVVLKNNHITHNVANGNNFALGGGVSIESGTNGSIIGNEISNNELNATGRGLGGGILVVYTTGTDIIGNTISNNMVNGNTEFGGGIHLFEGNALITNNIIFGNSAKNGGGINTDKSITQIINNTIVNNNAARGGGLATGARTTVVLNTIIWGNHPGSQIAGSVDIQYSDIEGGFTGTGNIDADPLFSDTSFNLSDSSACIGAGVDSILIGDVWYAAPLIDIGGNPRPAPSGSMPDMGAWESLLNSSIVSGIEVPLSNVFQMTYSLSQNYPNPFNPTTIISYRLPKPSTVELTISNVAGQRIATVVSGRQPAGSYQYEWDASALASGSYFYELRVGELISTKRTLLLK